MSTLNTSLALYDSAPTALYDRASTSMKVLSQMAAKASVNLSQTNVSIVNMNQSLEKTKEKSISALDVMGKVWGRMKAGMKIADDYSRLETRLKAVNGEIKNQGNLQDKVFAAANRSKVSYSEMVGTVTNLQGIAGGAFSADEALGMSELLHKSYELGGTDDKTQSSGIDQVVGAMGKGKIGSDVFDNITQNAPAMLTALETFTGKSQTELSAMAEAGTLTADVLKKAMFASSTDINSEFAKLPMTFDDISIRIKNAFGQAFGGVMDRIQELFKSDTFLGILNGVITVIFALGDAANWLIDTVVDGWEIIVPLLAIIGGILLAKIVGSIQKVIEVLRMQALAWMIAYWPVVLIIGIIAIAIAIARQLGATWEEICGVIGGVIGVFVGFFFNRFVKVWNFIAAFVNFFGNAFTNPIAAIRALFLDLAISTIGYILKIGQGIQDLLNNIPGVEINFTGKLEKLHENMKIASKTVKDEAGLKEYMHTKEFGSFTGFYNKGSDMGISFTTGLSDDLDFFSTLGSGSGGGFGNSSDLGTPSNPVSVQGTGSNGILAVDMAEEDIQYLRDIAERDYINKFSTATVAPNIQVSFGDIHKEADVDKVAGRIQRILREQIATAGEGVY